MPGLRQSRASHATSAHTAALDGYDPAWMERAVCAQAQPTTSALWSTLADRLALHIYQHPEVAPALCVGSPEVLMGDAPASGLPSWLAVLRRRQVAGSRLLRRRVAPLRCWQLLGDDIVGGGRDAASAFVEQVVQRLAAGDVDCLLIEALAPTSALWSALDQAEPDRRVHIDHDPPQHHWWIDIPEDTASYWTKFSSKTRYNLRRSARQLPAKVVCYRAENEVLPFLERAEYVSRRSWQGCRFGLRLRRCPEQIALLGALARERALRSYTLLQGDEPLAFAFCWQWRGRFMYEECGHLTACARKSAGTVLLYRILEDLLADDPPMRVDFGFGDSEQKRLFANRESTSRRVSLISRRLVPNLLCGISRLERGSIELVRRSLGGLGLRRLLRNRYRLRN